MKRLLRWGSLAALGLLLWIGTACAMDVSEFVHFEWHTGDQVIPVYLTRKTGDDSALYLPGAAGNGRWTVVLDRCESADLGGLTLRNGEEVDPTQWAGQQIDITLSTGRQQTGVPVMKGSPIPTLFFRMSEQDLRRIHMRKTLDIQGDASVTILDGEGSPACTDSLTSMHMRGNSTLFAGKKPYQFKLSHSASLFGMEKAKTWILLANWYDISLLRNQMTLDLCNAVGLRGTPDCRQTDVFINGKYYGTYLLTEKIQLRKGRLDITDMEDEIEELNDPARLEKLHFKNTGKHAGHAVRWFDINEPEDISGGFLMIIEKSLHFSINKEEAGFVTDGRMCVLMKEPDYIGQNAANYIAGIVNDFHNAVLDKSGVSPDTGKHYSEYIDMRSFAVKVAVEEFTGNYDARAGSQYMYKDSDAVDSKIYAGPGWDYDLIFGNHKKGMKNPLKKDYVYTRSSSKINLYHWMLTHDDFRAETRKAWLGEVLPAVEILLGRAEPREGFALRSMEQYKKEIEASAAMNFTRWSAKVVSDLSKESGRTFEDATAYVLDFMTKRADMMREEWLADAE